MFAKNMSSVERMLRILVGLVLLTLTVVGPQTAWGFVGFIPLLTGVMTYCPIYTVLGRNPFIRSA